MHQSRDVLRQVSVRTRDDTAVIQDLPKGRGQVGRGFPVTPVFDALSYFIFSWKVSSHQDVAASVHDVQPLQYDLNKRSEADVVVISLRTYKPQYAADSSEAPNGKTHLTLAPYQFVRDQSNPDTTFFFNDLYIDNATGLPTRVRFVGPNKEFVVDYATIEGHWLVDHVHYEETLRGPMRIGRLHVIGDANYDEFSFPTTPPDPRLN